MSGRVLSCCALLPVSLLILGQTNTPNTSPALAPAGQPSVSDLVVTLEHVGGKVETFKDEIARMELILSAAGRLDQVHLITQSGHEPDTHIWYNVNNLVSVRYQFLAITGKGKVTVRALTPPTLKPATEAAKKGIPVVEPEDYR